jgi:hypothetical protein
MYLLKNRCGLVIYTHMPHIIVTHLSNFMTAVLCNTIRRKVTEEMKVGDASEIYRRHLVHFCKRLDDMKFYAEYIDFFMGYCSQESYHALYDAMQKDIAAAFCGHEVAAQFGSSRLPIVVKGIFTKTLREAADRLIRTPNVLDMVANGSQGGKEPCARIVNMAIGDVITDYQSGNVDGSTSKESTVKVSSATYEALKEKYRRLTFAYNDVQHTLDKTLQMYEESLAEKKRMAQLIQGYKIRLREVEGSLSSFKTLERPADDETRVSSSSSSRKGERMTDVEKSMVSELSKKAAKRDASSSRGADENISIIPENIEPHDSVSNAPPSSPVSEKKKKRSSSKKSKETKKASKDPLEVSDMDDDAFNSLIYD